MKSFKLQLATQGWKAYHTQYKRNSFYKKEQYFQMFVIFELSHYRRRSYDKILPV